MSAKIDPFHAISLGALAYELAAKGQSVIHMEYGQPSTGAPSAAIAAAHAVLDRDPMGYWESPGLMVRIAAHYREEHGVAIAPEQVILTCGASPALVLALSTLFKPGDRVALARPGYVAYRNTLKALWMEPVELDCGEAERFQLTAAALAALDPAPAGLIVASPANPTGTVIAEAEMAAIALVCRERGIRMVSDEIYHGIVYGDPVRSVLCHAPDALVINSFSKYFSMAGWRLGWLVVPPDLVEPARARMGNLFLTPPSLAQHAGLAAFDCREELEGHIATYARNRALMLEALPRLGLRRIAPPDGAFYIYADIGHLTNDSLAFCQRLLRETGVATAPGIDFDPANGHRFIRFSFAVSTPEVQEALDRLERWLKAAAAAEPSRRLRMSAETLLAPRPAHVAEAAVYDFDYFHDAGLIADPHGRLLELASEAPPLFWTPRCGGTWIAIGYDVAFRVLREPETFSSVLHAGDPGAALPLLPNGQRIPLMTPIMMDPPEHTILRAPLQKTFSPKTVLAMKDKIEALAISLVEAVKPLGAADFVPAVTEALPVRIFLEMMGLPDDRIEQFRDMVREVLAPRGGDPGAELFRMRRVADAMEPTIRARRDNPRDDLISMLWAVEIEGQPMTFELMEDYCCLLFIAGLDTVINGMTYGIRHLAQHPELQAELRANPDLIVEATEELLRRYSFSGPVRRVTRETELAGQKLLPGDQVFVYMGAVDLDPREFPQPGAFDLTRENKNHLIFGAGPHRCLGSHLARVELQVLYRVVLERLPEFRMDPDRRPVFHPGNILSVSSLPIRWD